MKVHIHHPALLKIAEETPEGDRLILDNISSLEEGILESDVILPLEHATILKVTTLPNITYRFIITPKVIMVQYLNDLKDVNVPTPTDGYLLYWDAAAGKWQAKAVSASKIADADADTKVDTEQGPDEDIIRMHVAGVEAFVLQHDGILDLPKQSRADVRLTSDQTIATAAWTKIAFSNEQYDEQGEFDAVTNYRFTANKAGYYLSCLGAILIDMIAAKRIGLSIYKNGVHYALGGMLHGSHTCDMMTSFASIIPLAATDYIEAYLYHDTGANKTLSADLSHTFWHIHKLS
ncbi:hypothetical protein ES703_96305 [subsurface metagenome]